MKSSLFIGLLTICSLTILSIGWMYRQREETLRREQEAHPVDAAVFHVKAVTSLPWEEVSGVIQAEREVQVLPQWIGRVSSVLVQEGASVRTGQPLVQLEPQETEAQIANAISELQIAQTAYENASLTANMEAHLQQERVATARADLKQSEAMLEAARMQWKLLQNGSRSQERQKAEIGVEQAQANLDLAEKERDRTCYLVKEGAIAQREMDIAQAHYETARAQFETAQQDKSLIEEGNRPEVIAGARSSVQEAEAKVEAVHASLQRAEALFIQAQIRQNEVDMAQRQMDRQRIQLREAYHRQSAMLLRAPMEGRVSQCHVAVGMLAGPDTPLMHVYGGTLRVDVEIPPKCLKTLKEGMAVPVRLQTERQPRGDGRITALTARKTGMVASVALSFSPDRMAGHPVLVRFPVESKPKIWVPQAAVWEEKGVQAVFVIDTLNIARSHIVRIGKREGARYQVLAGLHEGESVLAALQQNVREGSVIRPHTKEVDIQ